MYSVTFNNKNSLFYNTVKDSVNNYFEKNNIKATGNYKLYLKALTLIPLAVFIYITLIFYTPAPFVSLVLCGIFGFILASIGFNVMHDACHGSYSGKKWVNDLLGLSLNALGGNAYIWKLKHNIVHHTYTNIDGIDDDIAKAPIMRQCKSQPRYKAHKYQHIYIILVYGLSSFLWVFLMDFAKYFTKKVYTTPIRNMDKGEHIIFWLSKLLYAVFYIAIPVYFVGWAYWLAGFFAMHFIMGLTLAIVFQLAHVVESTDFIEATPEQNKVESEWAVHQVKTTADFATDNKLVSWFVGGLNFQIEHHLFPRVSHVHYPAINKIVKDTCEKYNIPYNYYPTMTSAVVSHFRFMKDLGKA